LIDKYGADALRYYFLAKFSPFSDGDFSEEKFREVYNADLANGLGNLVARVSRLCEKAGLEVSKSETISNEVADQIKNFCFNEALTFIWGEISTVDKKINIDEPWKLPEEKLKPALNDYVRTIRKIGVDLEPFLPQTSEKILKQFSGKIKSSEPLFPRLA
jgi:methionyl-tRNA synthetase